MMYQSWQVFVYYPNRATSLLGAFIICLLMWVFLRGIFNKSLLSIQLSESELEIKDVQFPFVSICEKIPLKEISSYSLTEISTIKDLSVLIKNKRKVYSIKKVGMAQMLTQETCVHLTLTSGRVIFLLPSDPNAFLVALSKYI